MAQEFGPSITSNTGDTVAGGGGNGTMFTPVSDTPGEDYEAGVLKWVEQRLSEGRSILQDDPTYGDIDKNISYIMGSQGDTSRPTQLASVNDNRLKNILNQTVAALTDIHPVFGFKTENDAFKNQEEVLVKLAQAWWVNNFCDLKLADVIKFAAGMGTGYCEVAWDAAAQGGSGDISLRPVDPRNVIPITPTLAGSVQDWGGVIIQTAKSPDELKLRFPDKAHRIEADNQPSLVARSWSRARKAMSKIMSPVSAVDVANGSNSQNMPKKVPSTDVFTTYLKDRRLHTGAEPKIMGDPSTTWCYKVYPVGYTQVPDGNNVDGSPKFRKAKIADCKLYPRGRMIVATKKAVLYDGPNPYWHGMFPVAKLSLDPWPWSLLGVGLVGDLIPMQDAYTELLNGTLDHIRKVLRPAVIADKKSFPTSLWERIDTRLPGMKLKTNAVAGKGVEFQSPEALPSYVFEMIKYMAEEMDYHAGTANLAAMMQMNQVPGEDTIEKMREAMTPVLRLKGRLMEYFLREIGEMVKSNFFQFYNLPRRIAILGSAGISFNDFDFDPGTLIPALSSQDQNYTPELDKSKTRAERAQWYQKNFTFSITPNSLLAVSQISRKLMYLQLRQMQLVDRWTLYDVLEVPNGGTPPGNEQTITDRLNAEQQMMMEQQMAAAAAIQAGMGPEGGGGGPGVNPPKEGRPPTYQQAPSLLNKTEEGTVIPRQTISSSGSGGG